jgi:hypothetical protein
MKVGFYLSLRTDPALFLHASSLVREATKHLKCDVIQFSDEHTPMVPGVIYVERLPIGHYSGLLHHRLEHYRLRSGEWLFLDTDVSVRNDVRGVFDDPAFDVAVCDRQWSHLPQGESVMHEMPFNTGVMFTRCPAFWYDVLQMWLAYPEAIRKAWTSEQQAVYAVVRTGRYKVKILSGMAYNYPPTDGHVVPIAALVHYKGPRKSFLSQHAYQVLSTCA